MTSLELTAPIVSVDWLADHLDHPDLLILDGTIKKVTSDTSSDLAGKLIKNARFFDLKGAFSNKDTDLPNMLPTAEAFTGAGQELGIRSDHYIVVYDQLGIYSSARVWWMFHVMGHKNIAVLDGGLPAWKAAGFPLETVPDTEKALPQGNFSAQYQPGSTVNASDVLQLHHDPDVLILDARSNGRFYGTAPEPRDDLRSGHIPNSMNLPYTRVLDDGKMRPVAVLKSIFEDFDIGDKKLIFSCGSGITACIILLAATLAGYKDLKVYDGSWTEWGQLEGVPIAT